MQPMVFLHASWSAVFYEVTVKTKKGAVFGQFGMAYRALVLPLSWSLKQADVVYD